MEILLCFGIGKDFLVPTNCTRFAVECDGRHAQPVLTRSRDPNRIAPRDRRGPSFSGDFRPPTHVFRLAPLNGWAGTRAGVSVTGRTAELRPKRISSRLDFFCRPSPADGIGGLLLGFSNVGASGGRQTDCKKNTEP